MPGNYWGYLLQPAARWGVLGGFGRPAARWGVLGGPWPASRTGGFLDFAPQGRFFGKFSVLPRKFLILVRILRPQSAVVEGQPDRGCLSAAPSKGTYTPRNAIFSLKQGKTGSGAALRGSMK